MACLSSELTSVRGGGAGRHAVTFADQALLAGEDRCPPGPLPGGWPL